MNFFVWRKNLSVTELDPTFKVRYLGNVQTTLTKGEGCTDHAVSIIWNNSRRSAQPGIEMKMILTGSGMKAYTKEQGLTEYRAHRISYCIAHPSYPRLFVWVYRHDGRKMKMELRCHAVLCKNEATAKTMALQLHQKLSFALREFQREKLRKQTSRLTLQRFKSSSKIGNVLPLRTQLLSTAKNFKPPVSKSHTAPRLGSITEDVEEDECIEEDDVEEEEVAAMIKHLALKRGSVGTLLDSNDRNNSPPLTPLSAGPLTSGLLHNGLEHHDILEALDLESAEGYDSEYFNSDPIIDLEVGNDLDELRRDEDVQFCLKEGADSDEESSESGFQEQDQDLAENEKENGRRRESSSGDKEEYNISVCRLPAYNIECSTTAQKTSL